jgi:hypothetical protein
MDFIIYILHETFHWSVVIVIAVLRTDQSETVRYVVGGAPRPDPGTHGGRHGARCRATLVQRKIDLSPLDLWNPLLRDPEVASR